MKDLYTIKLSLTNSGRPALWEKGGGMTVIGHAVIIAGTHGEKLSATYIKRGGHLSNGEHALFVVGKGYHVIEVHTENQQPKEITVLRIEEIEGEYAGAELVNRWLYGEWDSALPEYLQEAVDAAIKKACIYHCRGAVYLKEN